MRVIQRKLLLAQAGMLLVGLFFLLSACSSPGSSQPSANSTSTPTAQNAGTQTPSMTTPSPGIRFGPQSCPAQVNNPAYWDTIVPTQSGVSKVNSVTCGYMKGIPALQALVTVLYSNATATLDVYVYDQLGDATPQQIFKLQNLIMGKAKISVYNTLETAEVDKASSQNANQDNTAWTPDLFREFKWSDSVGTLVQVSFPGVFPDLTRYQAEADQAQVNQGHQPWKLSPTSTAQAFGAALLHWDPNASATLVSGGSGTDVQAEVKLTNTARPTGSSVMLSMTRLEGNANGGIWIITDALTDGLTITQPQAGAIMRSDTTVTGTGSAFEGIIGPVTILDHLYTDIGHATAHGAIGNGKTTFSTRVTSHPTFSSGAQEGLVVLTTISNANGTVAGIAIVKVLIQV